MNNQIQVVLKSSTAEMSLNDHDSGIYIVPELNGLTGLPDIRTTSGVNAGYDGGWTSAQNYDARSITLRGVIANEDKASVERMRKQLVSLLGQGKNEELTLDIVTEAGSAYEIQVRTIACEMAMQRVLTQQEFMIQLRADDPLIYDNTEAGEPAIVQVQKALGGFQIPFEIPLAIGGGEDASVIDNHGLEQVAPIVKMYGALHNPKIINQTTNQYMQIEADLGYAEGAYIDAEQSDSGQNISFDAPIAAPLSDFSLKGNTTQQTYTGKNLFNLNTSTKGNSGGNNAVSHVVSNSDLTITQTGNGGNGYVWFEIPNSDSLLGKTVSISVGSMAHSGTTSTGRIIIYTNNLSEVANFSSITSSGWSASFSFPSSYPSGASSFRVYAYLNNANTTTSVGSTTKFTNIQLELGSSATSYEPYVGGVPAPNPDYPQAVQTVTGEQIVEICGKNLWGADEHGSIDENTGENVYNANRWRTVGYIPVKSNTAYTLSSNASADIWHIFCFYDSGKNFISGVAVYGGSQTQTTPANCQFMRCVICDTASIKTTERQLELGSATTYEPYQGQSYTVDLGSIELCKIGTYQDYIYKDGTDWKIHKEIGKVIRTGDQTENWSVESSSLYTRFKLALPSAYYSSSRSVLISDHFHYIESGHQVGGAFLYMGQSYLYYGDQSTTVENFKTWLSTNNVEILYPLATATDTTITNATLIAQLDAILSGGTQAGANTITTVIAAGNAQGEVQVSYYTHQDPATRDEIIIDSRLRTITLNGLDIYDKKTDGSEFLMLAPGENKLMLQSDIDGDNGYAEVNYKQGYLSI